MWTLVQNLSVLGLIFIPEAEGFRTKFRHHCTHQTSIESKVNTLALRRSQIKLSSLNGKLHGSTQDLHWDEDDEQFKVLNGGTQSEEIEVNGVVSISTLEPNLRDLTTGVLADNAPVHSTHVDSLRDKIEATEVPPPPKLPRHEANMKINDLLVKAESVLSSLHGSLMPPPPVDGYLPNGDDNFLEFEDEERPNLMDFERHKQQVFANSYVDLGKIDTIGFDYDYTLVTYSNELLSLIYDMALDRLVRDKHYPRELKDLLHGKFDPFFSIRGLAVDKETGWICHLSYTHKVAVAWEGRERVTSARLRDEYSYKRSLSPAMRKKRLKPLNDLFSMAECCLIADVVHFFKVRGIPFFPSSCVADILHSIGATHISGDFHRLVAANPQKYFEPKPHLKSVLEKLHNAGKRLIFVSNSPFWYVDAGMKYVIGEHWREMWDVVIVSAGKPAFYTEDARPFREVSARTGRIKFKKVLICIHTLEN